MIKLCKWGYGRHMHIFKLIPILCSGIVHIEFNSGILRCRKLIMNIFSKPKTLITFQANTQMTNFYVLLTVHPSIILGSNQLDTRLLYFTIHLL